VSGGQPDAQRWKHGNSCQGGACVEVAREAGRVAVRNSAKPGSILAFSASSWRDFVARVKKGEFDADRLTGP
jgi:hypothetical protein